MEFSGSGPEKDDSPGEAAVLGCALLREHQKESEPETSAGEKKKKKESHPFIVNQSHHVLARHMPVREAGRARVRAT